jgi:hypothetical protein
VGVIQDGTRVTTADFVSADFLAGDWEFADPTTDPALVDVTGWILESNVPGTNFAQFAAGAAVSGAPVTDDPTTPTTPTTSGSLPSLPASGDFVLVSKSGRTVWEPVKDV